MDGHDSPPGTAAHTTLTSAEQRELAALRERVAAHEGQPRAGRWRRVLSAVLGVLTVVALVATTAAVWTRTATETDRFMGLVTPVLESPEVADALSARLTAEVVSALDLETRLDARLAEVGAGLGDALGEALELTPVQRARVEALPLPQLQGLAGPIASGLEARLATRIDQFVHAPEFQRLMVDATQLAHTKAVALLRGDFDQLPNVEVAEGEVRLNLVAVVATVLADLIDQGLAAVGIEEIPFIDPLADPEASLERLSAALDTDLPPDFGQLTVMSETELTELQDMVATADRLVWLLAVVTLLLLAGTIAAAPQRRRAVIGLSLGTAAGLVITMALLRTTTDEIASVAVTPEGGDALRLITDAVLDSLRSVMLVVLAIALAIGLAAYLLGRPPWFARSIVAVQDGTAQEYVATHRDMLRIGVVAVAVVLLLLLGVGLWTVGILSGIVLLILWALSSVHGQGPGTGPPAVAT